MNRSKALYPSQGDLTDSVDSTEYKVASNSCLLHELNAAGNKLPLVIRIDDGFYGKTDWTTISSDEILFLYGLKLRKRALATAEDGTRYSFPLDYPLPFIPQQPSISNSSTKPNKSGKQKPEIPFEVSSFPMSLKEIIANHKLPISVVIDDAYVIFHSSNHDRETVHFGKLTLTHVYDEKYYVGNEIRNGNLSHQITLLPTFLRIKVRLVQGFSQKKRKQSWKAVVAEWTATASKINYDDATPPSDVAAFQSEAVAKKSPAKLDSIEPNTYIKLTFLPLEKDHTYEELPIVSPGSQSSESGVSTFKQPTKPANRPGIPRPERPLSDEDPYNLVESPTSETTSFLTIQSHPDPPYQRQNLTLPGKRLEPRSYSPVPSPPIAVPSDVRVGLPLAFLQKPINRAPMPLPKPSGNAETRPTPDLPYNSPIRNPCDGFSTLDRSTSDLGSRVDINGQNESPKATRAEPRREHPPIPLPPFLKPSDLTKPLKPTNKSVNLGTSLTSLDTETQSSEERRTPPRKPKPTKPRSKTDLSLSTTTVRYLQQETTRQGIKASQPGCSTPDNKLPVPKPKASSTNSNNVPFAKTRAPPENDQDVADLNTSLPDLEELHGTKPNIKPLQMQKLPHPLPQPLPRANSKSSLTDNEVFCASPKAPLPPPKFFQPDYECPSRDLDSNPTDIETTSPQIPQMNYEKLPTKDQYTIESIADIPEQLESLSCFHLADCLRLLNMEGYVKTFLSNQIDGKLLLELDEEILTSDLNVSKLHAKKLLMFAHRGWRP